MYPLEKRDYKRLFATAEQDAALIEYFRGEPETIHIQYLGTERPFLLVDRAAEITFETLGLDPVASAGDLLQRVYKAAGPGLSALRSGTGSPLQLGVGVVALAMEAIPGVFAKEGRLALREFGDVLYWGLVFFDRSLRREDIVITPGIAVRLARDVFRALTSFAEDDEPESVADRETEELDEEEAAKNA